MRKGGVKLSVVVFSIVFLIVLNFSSALLIGGSDSGYFNGTIDELRIYGRVLTQDEILSYYNSTITTLEYEIFTKTDESGDYNVSINAPTSVGDHEIFVNTTYNSIYGENSQILSVTQSNRAPTNPTPTLTSASGTNYTDTNLICSDTISDPDGDSINVSVKWYKNGVLDSIVYYNNSYADTAGFNAILDSSNTNVGENWTCSLRFHDGILYSNWVNSSILTIIPDISTYFISTWDTTKTGISDSNSIILPLISGGSYDFTVYWGDGNSGTVTSWDDTDKNHTYVSPGEYTINISGTIEGFRFNNGGDKKKIIDIIQWGNLKLGNNGYYFYGCSNLNASATDTLDTTGMTNFVLAFRDATNFNGDIGGWDMSSATVIQQMFMNADSFNQDLDQWDTSNVVTMNNIFRGADSFNGNVSTWDTSGVSSMLAIFRDAVNFNGDISNWNTSSVTDMSEMFYNADGFNQSLNSWDTSSVTDMNNMFAWNDAFNGSISNWNTSSVIDMSEMFEGANSFTQNISAWDTSSVNNMSLMFSYNTGFNGNISAWDTSSVTDMSMMFRGAASPFNQDISSWNTSSVTDMTSMFRWNPVFDQNLGNWNISSLIDAGSMFDSVTLSTANYDALLNGWASQTPNLQDDVEFSGGNSLYSFAANVSRNGILIGTHNWTIIDGGIYNTLPTVPTLIAPSNGDTTIHERLTTFNWSESTDADGHPITYDINVTNNVYADFSQTEIISIYYTSPSVLGLDESQDGTYNYFWQVRACDPYSCSDWSEQWNFSIEPWVAITLVNSTIDFGSGYVTGDENDTTNNDPLPFHIRNDGNVQSELINISADDDLWVLKGLDTEYTKIKGRNASELNSFNWDNSIVDWVNISGSISPIISQLNYEDANDEAYVDMYIKVPEGEPPGTKNITVRFVWEQAP